MTDESASLKPARDPDRAALARLNAALRALHQRLVSAEQVRYERWHGRIGPGALLQLLLHDPFFAWLLPLSSFLAKVDGWVADPEVVVDRATLARVRGTVEGWVLHGGEDGELTSNYLALLQTDPDVVMAHAAVRRELSEFPPAARGQP